MLEIAALGYHEVTDDPGESGFQRPRALLYKHTRAAFTAHLDVIARGPLTPSLVTAIDFSGDGQHLVLTFDDGGRSAQYVGEVLCRRGWRGHFLITTGMIGNRTFLTTQAIRELRQAGHVVGSHSHDHPDVFRAQSIDAMAWQWRTSCDRIAQCLGEPCVVASVPGGEISEAVLRSASEAEIRYLFTSEPHLQPAVQGNCLVLGRASIKVHTSIAQVRRLARCRGWRRARLERQCTSWARRAFPTAYAVYLRSHARWLYNGRPSARPHQSRPDEQVE